MPHQIGTLSRSTHTRVLPGCVASRMSCGFRIRESIRMVPVQSPGADSDCVILRPYRPGSSSSSCRVARSSKKYLYSGIYLTTLSARRTAVSHYLLADQITYELLTFIVSSCSYVLTSMSTMMPLAEPLQILCRFNPRAYLVRITDSRILLLQLLEVYTVLERELDVRVVQLHSAFTLCTVTSLDCECTLCCCMSSAPVGFELGVVWITWPRRMCRIVHSVLVTIRLIMCWNR